MRYEKMPVEVVIDLLDEAAKNGGLTVAHTGFMAYEPIIFTSGYMVGGYSGVVTISGHDSEELCAALINNLIKAKNDEGLGVNEYLGLWVNETGHIEVEYSRAFNNLDEAMQAARLLKQRYIYDIKNARALKV